MSPVGIDGKIEAEGEIYLTNEFWKRLEETFQESPIFHGLEKALEEPEPLDWYDIREYRLDDARDDELVTDFPDEGDIVHVVSMSEGAAVSIKFDSRNADPFDLSLDGYKRIKHTYTDLYLTNDAQSGAKIKILFGRGDWDLTETIPEMDVHGTIRNDYLEQITDPLKIGEIIEDGHIKPHADIACEKILITGTTRLDQWRSTDDYTFIAPGKILLHATTKLSDWQHPSDTTYIHGGQIYTESIETDSLAALSITTEKLAAGAVIAEKMTITDLADIVNLLTVAEGKILIGEDVLGADLHGIKIIDEQATPVTRVKIGHLESGVENYGISMWDEDGIHFCDMGHLQQIWEKVYDAYTSVPRTQVSISGLDGNADQLYFIFVKAQSKNGAHFGIRLNGDSGANYGVCWVGYTGNGVRDDDTWFYLLDQSANDQWGQCFTMIDAKTGKVRTANTIAVCRIAGKTIGAWYGWGNSWSNTVDNITSIQICAGAANGMGAGAHISIYKIPSY